MSQGNILWGLTRSIIYQSYPRGTLQILIGGSALMSNPLPFCTVIILTEELPFWIPFIENWYLFHIPTWEHCIRLFPEGSSRTILRENFKYYQKKCWPKKEVGSSREYSWGALRRKLPLTWRIQEKTEQTRLSAVFVVKFAFLFCIFLRE